LVLGILIIMKQSDIKLAARYLTIIFFGYLSWFILQPEFINNIKGMGDIGIGAIYTSVLGSIAYIVKTNWSTVPEENK